MESRDYQLSVTNQATAALYLDSPAFRDPTIGQRIRCVLVGLGGA